MTALAVAVTVAVASAVLMLPERTAATESVLERIGRPAASARRTPSDHEPRHNGSSLPAVPPPGYARSIGETPATDGPDRNTRPQERAVPVLQSVARSRRRGRGIPGT